MWILDGLEVTIVGAIASGLQEKDTLALSAFQIAFGGTCYIIGFGYLTDRLGRKRLFIVTLAVYLVATVATAFTWNAPRRFAPALRRAAVDGRVRRVDRRTWAATDRA